MHDTWYEIHDWLILNAPRTARQLSRPQPDAVDRVAAHLGCVLPPELDDYLDVVPDSGYTAVFGLHALLPADRMNADSVMREDISRDVLPDQPPSDRAGDPEHAWSSRFLALTSDEGGAFFVDLREGDLHGSIRSWDKVDGSVLPGPSVWPGPYAYLKELVAALKDGSRFDKHWVAFVEDESLYWEVL